MTPAARARILEEAIRRKGWSEATCSEVMKDTEASRATVYRDRVAILKRLAAEDAIDLEQRRALFLSKLRAAQSDAAKADKWATVARLLDTESQLLGLDRVPLPTVEAVDGTAIDTSLEYVLAEVRRMRKSAELGHSYVAAERLVSREAELVQAIEVRDRAAREAELAGLDEAELVEHVIMNVRLLPPALLDRLRAALAGL